MAAVPRSAAGYRRTEFSELRPRPSGRPITAVANYLRADLDELLFQGCQRPVFDQLGRRQRAQKIAEIVGQRIKL